jgi:hypothetical protein
MSRVIRIGAALLIACVASLANAAENAARIAGTYQGEAFNGGDLDAITTTFSFDSGGRLRGEYVVDEEEGEFKGRLSNFSFEGPRTIRMEWTDKFGEGFAVMEFAQDYRSFTGEWSDQSGSNALPWSGEKVSSSP